MEVLDFFLNIPESFVSGLRRDAFYRLIHNFPHEQVLTCSNISQIFSNLKSRGYIKVEEKDGCESISFTNKARLAIVDKIAQRSKTDNKYYLVSFNIPERLRLNRDKFRRTLKRLGFKQIQKSLWVLNKNVGSTVELAAIEYNVNSYIAYFVSDNTNINDVINSLLSKKTD